MAYTLTTVFSRVQDKLDNTSFSTASLLYYANDTEREIFNRYRIPGVTESEDTSVTTTASSNALSGLPTNANRYINFRTYTPSNYSTVLPYVEYEEADIVYPNLSLLGNGPPIAWTTFGGVPQLVNNADATYTLRTKYIINPTELTAGADTPNIPVEYSEILVLGIYARALEHDDEFDKASVVRQQMDQLAVDYVAPRQAGFPHLMRQPLRLNRIIGRR